MIGHRHGSSCNQRQFQKRRKHGFNCYRLCKNETYVVTDVQVFTRKLKLWFHGESYRRPFALLATRINGLLVFISSAAVLRAWYLSNLFPFGRQGVCFVAAVARRCRCWLHLVSCCVGCRCCWVVAKVIINKAMRGNKIKYRKGDVTIPKKITKPLSYACTNCCLFLNFFIFLAKLELQLKHRKKTLPFTRMD